MKKLIFLDIEEFKKLKNFNRKNIILLEYPPKDFSGLDLKIIEKFNIEEFFPKELFKNIEKKSKKLLEEFYKKVDKKVIYKHIDLFSVIKNILAMHFNKYVQHIEILDYIIKKNKPKKILIKYNKRENNFLENPELSVSIIKEICSIKKIPLKIIAKKRKKRLKINSKDSLLNILGVLQNIHFNKIISKKIKEEYILFIGGKKAYLPILDNLKGKIKRIRCGIEPRPSFLNNSQDNYITFWNKPKSNIKFKKGGIFKEISQIKYKGFSFYNIILPNLNYLFDIYLKILARWVDITYKIEPKLKSVVTTNDTIPLEQIIIKILKKNKKKSYHLQHGYTTSSESLFPLVKEKMLADKMLVWGDTSKEWMIEQGLKKEGLIVTGSIKFDEYAKNENLVDIRKKFDIKKNKKIICFIAQPNKNLKLLSSGLSHKEGIELYKTLFNTIKKLKEFFLIIKLHPSEEYENLSKEILKKEKIKNAIILDKNSQLKPLLKQSDLIITVSSSVSLEVMFFKKPLLIINFFNKEPTVPFVENGMCKEIRDKNKLKESMINSIKNKDKLVKKYEKYLKDYAIVDGNSYKRISNIILNDKV